MENNEKEKTIFIIGINSELAQIVSKILKNKNWKIYATSRQVNALDEGIHEFHLDVQNEFDFIHLKDKIKNLEFDRIINFSGIAIADAVEKLNESELKKQLDVNLFGLLRIIKYFSKNLKKDGILLNISSMAHYGIFPFLAPYSISKAACDILLNNFSLESNVKTVSIRPGAVATKFWEKSIELNKDSLDSKDEKFKKEKDFLIRNANNNSLHAKNPFNVAQKIAQIIELKNPKKVYNIGLDAKIAKLSRFLPLDFVNFFIKLIFNKRINKTKC